MDNRFEEPCFGGYFNGEYDEEFYKRLDEEHKLLEQELADCSDIPDYVPSLRHEIIMWLIINGYDELVREWKQFERDNDIR